MAKTMKFPFKVGDIISHESLPARRYRVAKIHSDGTCSLKEVDGDDDMRPHMDTIAKYWRKCGFLWELRKSYYELVDMFKGGDFFRGYMTLMFIMLLTVAAIGGIGLFSLLVLAIFLTMPKWASIPLACVIIVPFCFGIIARYFIPPKESRQ